MKPPFLIKRTFFSSVVCLYKSEGQIFIVADLFKLRHCCRSRRGCICRCAIAFGNIRLTHITACHGAFILCINKVCLVCNYLCSVVLYSVVICPVSVLECSYNADGACLLEISCNELCSLSPCCDVDEVCLRFLTVTSAKATVYRDCEGCYGMLQRIGYCSYPLRTCSRAI